MNKLIGLIMVFCLPALAKPQIAYNALLNDSDQNYDIFVMDTDGKGARNITNHPAIDWVYYSVNGLLYFVSDRDQCRRCFYLYEMRSDGTELRKITDFEVADAWLSSRKKGTQLIVRPAQQNTADFLIIDLNGDPVRRVETNLKYASDPAFSPDGTAIVFRGADHASARELGFVDSLYILSLSQDAEQAQLLYRNPQARGDQPWAGYYAAAPRWPQADKISFAAKIDGNYDIYTITPEGENLQPVSPQQSNQVFHDWHAEHGLIFEASADNHSGYELYKQRANEDLQRLTNDEIEQYAPVFVDD